MKKMVLMVVMAMVLSVGQPAFAGDVLDSLLSAVGGGVANAIGNVNGIVNVTTTLKDSEIKGKNVDVGVVEVGSGYSNAIINVTTVAGKIEAKETARVGVVKVN